MLWALWLLVLLDDEEEDKADEGDKAESEDLQSEEESGSWMNHQGLYERKSNFISDSNIHRWTREFRHHQS
jgi:hypothetical protein